MERRIDLSNLDLDDAAQAVAARRDTWVSAGLQPSRITWTDNDPEWPTRQVIDRSAVQRPRSLGIRIVGSHGAEAEFVLYVGGWADAAYLPSGGEEVVQEHVEVDSVAEFSALLDRVVQLLTP
jgi:hypothetical protein